MLMETIDRYLTMRRACGYKRKSDERMLRSYARFAAERGERHVRQQSALEWAALGSSPLRREQRLRRVVIFARHVHVEDRTHEVPPMGVFSTQHTTRRIPYILSEEELERLLSAALRLGPPARLRPRTFYTLYGLLACTGLRISEALQLRLEDVTEDGLLIRESKNKHSRLVPLHETSSSVLKDYIAKRERVVATTNHLFVIEPQRRCDPICRPVRYQMARTTFHSLVQKCDIRPKPGCPAPRLHDMRHRFSIRALENSPAGSEHVSIHMLALSTYLGHICIKDTYWYLQATPSLMEGIADACSEFIRTGGQP